MEFVVLGWPPDGPQLRLDYQRFSYAGKFVMSNTGKAVVRDPSVTPDGSEFAEDVLAAVAFNEDRTDAATLWLRYITVRADRRGEGLGPRLARFAAERGRERGYDTVQIAANNPFAYEALQKAGFGYTGEQTGIAELVLTFPASRDRERYQAGLDVYRERDLSTEEESFLRDRRGSDPPAVVDDPGSGA